VFCGSTHVKVTPWHTETTHYKTLKQTATLCNTLQHTATHFTIHFATTRKVGERFLRWYAHWSLHLLAAIDMPKPLFCLVCVCGERGGKGVVLGQCATYCNIATHCNTLQHCNTKPLFCLVCVCGERGGGGGCEGKVAGEFVSSTKSERPNKSFSHELNCFETCQRHRKKARKQARKKESNIEIEMGREGRRGKRQRGERVRAILPPNLLATNWSVLRHANRTFQ